MVLTLGNALVGVTVFVVVGTLAFMLGRRFGAWVGDHCLRHRNKARNRSDS